MEVKQTEKLNMDTLIQGNNQLALNLHKVLAAREKSTCFSPFSLSSVMTMLLHGIRGQSETELRECLGFSGVGNDALLKSFQSKVSSLNTSSEGYTISNANCLFGAKRFEVLEKYRSDITEYFKADFFQEDITQAACTKINNWVKEKTNGKISQILDSVSPLVVMVLLNAVYFKGSWRYQFKKEATYKQLFYNKGLTEMAKEVDMMHMSGTSFNVALENSYKVAELPYKGQEMAMLVFLPNSREGLEELENSFSSNFITEIRSKMRRSLVNLTLPKFKFEYSADVRECFKKLNVRGIFAPSDDFAGMSKERGLCVSMISHKAVLKVNEEGCEAYAVTAVTVKGRCAKPRRPLPVSFVVDHPFLYVIYDRRDNLILFMGRITELG